MFFSSVHLSHEWLVSYGLHSSHPLIQMPVFCKIFSPEQRFPLTCPLGFPCQCLEYFTEYLIFLTHFFHLIIILWSVLLHCLPFLSHLLLCCPGCFNSFIPPWWLDKKKNCSECLFSMWPLGAWQTMVQLGYKQS